MARVEPITERRLPPAVQRRDVLKAQASAERTAASQREEGDRKAPDTRRDAEPGRGANLDVLA